MQPPNLFDRGLNQLIADGENLAQLYTPDWTNVGDPRDAGRGLLVLGARLVELLAERINRVPEKNLLAFLDLVGVERRAGMPAEAPVTFLLSNRSEEGALVPAGTQVATTQTEGTDAQVFETRDTVFATPAQLVNTINLLPTSDQYALLPPLALPPKPADVQNDAATIEILSGHASGLGVIEHALYLASAKLFARKEATDVGLQFTITSGSRAVFDSTFITWQRFNSDSKQWEDIANVTYATIGIDGVLVTFAGFPGTGKSSIAGDEGAWIACRLKRPPSQIPVLPRIGNVVGMIATAQPPPTQPDALCFNGTPLDASKPVFPFGERPRYGDAFHIASAKAFGPDIEAATVSITLRAYTVAELQAIFTGIPTNTTITTKVEWQYLADDGVWKTITTFTHTLNLTNLTQTGSAADKDGTLFGTIGGSPIVAFHFAPSSDAAVGEVAGTNSYWLRAILLSQAPYGRDGFVRIGQNNALVVVGPTFIPPIIEKIEIDYKYKTSAIALDRITTSNNFEFEKEQPPFFGQGKTFLPFVALSDYAPADVAGFLGSSPALYLSFDRAFGSAFISVLMLFLESQNTADLMSMSTSPHVVWEYLATGLVWKPLDIKDGTADLTASGIIGFQAPPDALPQVLFSQLSGSKLLYWYRARLQSGTYAPAPRLKAVVLNTVMADNQQTAQVDWVLASGSGEPDQRATILRRPVLAGDIWIRENEVPSEVDLTRLREEFAQQAIEKGVADVPTDVVEERLPDGGDREVWVRWLSVPNFHVSGPSSRHYTLEAVTGEVTFGNGDAGLTPPIGKDNIVVRGLRTGGGEAANRVAAPLAIKELKTSLPFVDKVFNLSGAVGGADPWSLEQTFELGPQVIKNRNRAVTSEDYDWVTLENFSQVKRAKCLATVEPRDGKLAFKPGAVSVIVVPKGPEAMPQPSKALLRRIEEFLGRQALGAIADATDIHALPPAYRPVAIAAKVRPEKPEDASLIERRVVQALNEFFHPLTGGEQNNGWPFGRSVYISEVFAVIERVPGVDHVVEAKFVDQPASTSLDVDDNGLVASGIHQIAIV